MKHLPNALNNMHYRIALEIYNNKFQQDVCKTLCPRKIIFFTDVLYNGISQFKISSINV